MADDISLMPDATAPETAAPPQDIAEPLIASDAPEEGQPDQPQQPQAEVSPLAPDLNAQLAAERAIRENLERQYSEERLRRAQEIEDARAMEQSSAAYAQRLMQTHALTEEQAQAISLQEHQRVYRDYLSERSRRDQAQAATRIAQQYGIDRNIIANLNSAQDMMSVAQAYAGVADIRKQRDTFAAENARLKKQLAPAQQFNNGAAPSAGMGATRDNIDVLYAQDPVRFGPVYRKFLRTGQI
jgi:hypothetical protein